jgi:hypothetical protein
MDITTAWTELHLMLRDNGFAPTLHILDNECSHLMQQAFTKHLVNFQLVPPHVHRRNAAERAIQTWKNHFCAWLATCDPKFPLTEWDRLMPQANLTLNLLRSSRRYSTLSAHSCVNKAFDFLNTPLALPGTRVVAHITPVQRANMAPHGVDGWYVGPSLDHYRCQKCYIPSTSQSWNVLTIDWFPHTVPTSKSRHRRLFATNRQRHAQHSPKPQRNPLATRLQLHNEEHLHSNRADSSPSNQANNYLALDPCLGTESGASTTYSHVHHPCRRTEGGAHTCSNETRSRSNTTNQGDQEATAADSSLDPKCSSPCPLFSSGRFPSQVRTPHCRLSHHTHRRKASIPLKAPPRP